MVSVRNVLFSWIYDDFNELPYLSVIGDPGSGKTQTSEKGGKLRAVMDSSFPSKS